MKLMPSFMLAVLVLFAGDTPKKEADRSKAADTWVEKFSKDDLPKGVPRWWDVFGALERKYGKGKVPCTTFDSARAQYFKEIVTPWAMKENLNTAVARQEFMKDTDLPTAWTLTGRKRQGCLVE